MQITGILLVLVVILQLLSSTQTKVVIEPTPNGNDVALLSSESKLLNCKLENGQKGEAIVWVDPTGNIIFSDPNSRIYVSGNKSLVGLELKSPNKRDSGLYRCVSRKNNRETDSQMFHLHVFNPTSLSGQTNYQKSEGNRVEMECLATADRDTTNVQLNWTFGQQDLSQEPAKYHIKTIPERSDIKKDEMRMRSRLEIWNVTKEHGGDYTCKVHTTNRFLFYEKKLQLNLHVQYKPRIDDSDQIIWIADEEVHKDGPLPLNFSCIVDSDPRAMIRWFGSDGKQIVSQSLMKPGQKERTVLKESENKSILTVHYRSIDDIKSEVRNNGKSSPFRYTCHADNLHGNARKTYVVKVRGLFESTPNYLKPFVKIN